MKDKAPELLPCHSCGTVPTVVHAGELLSLECPCWMSCPYWTADLNLIVSDWNTRADKTIDAEALREKLVRLNETLQAAYPGTGGGYSMAIRHVTNWLDEQMRGKS